MASRLIVKNLPKKISQEKVKDLFSDYGNVTDCSLKYSKDGVFRRFAFIGFSSEESAQSALEALHDTYVNTSKINVQLAADLTKSSHKLSNEVQSKEFKEEKSKKKSKPHVTDQVLGELEEDEGFQEFLDIHKASTSATSWRNDDESVNSKLLKGSKHSGSTSQGQQLAFEGDSDDSSDEEAPPDVNTKGDKDGVMLDVDDTNKPAKDAALSDMEYLRKKAAQASHLSDDETELETKAISASTEVTDAKPSKSRRKRKPKELFAAKMSNLPPNANKLMVQSFLQGISLKKVDIPRNNQKVPLGVAFVRFKSLKELEAALRRNRNMMGKKKVTIKRVTEQEGVPEMAPSLKEKPRDWELKNKLEGVEPIADSGRLFIRNLAHSVTEEDLEKTFGEFGALTDVNLPIDPASKRVKGFAHITYMFPEHAVQACNQLDGTNYMGRLLHILPGKPRIDELTEFDEGFDFKKKQKKEQKKGAQSSHNWNSLFLGGDAVANAMAAKYDIDKSQVLQTESGQSLGVRLALGETEVVNETRDFLIENGVCLDSFSQAAGPRSKTVILVKNLPSYTTVEELTDIFTKFGTVGRLLLPPSGISALVEFQEGQEAKAAFTKLAYSRFKHKPLYLEWAPMAVFAEKAEQRTDTEATQEVEDDSCVPEGSQEDSQEKKIVKTEKVKVKKESVDTDSDATSEEEEEGGGEGCTLFVKNLNFETTEKSLKKHFKQCGKVLNATVATKRDSKNPGKALSMGYGFVQFQLSDMAMKALKELQHSTLDKHNLELKLSERTVARPSSSGRKKSDPNRKQISTKILCRNVPFQANRKEITELFKVFGELKLVRLPKKVGGQHRGFCFVDFVTKNDAKRAFNALCHSTHLYGRRLVLEWADTAEESVENLRKKTADGYSSEKQAKRFKRSEMQDTLEEMEANQDD